MRRLSRPIFLISLLVLVPFAQGASKIQTNEPCDLACTPVPVLVRACERAGGTFTCCGCVFR
jgi:hypothetical protein